MQGRVKLGLLPRSVGSRSDLRMLKGIKHPSQRAHPKEMRERDFLARGPVG